MVNAAKWQAVVLCGKHGSGQCCEVAGRGSMALGKTVLCEKHGGGQRCEVAGCGSMARGKTVLCGKHGGGQRCGVVGCAATFYTINIEGDQKKITQQSRAKVRRESIDIKQQ